MEIDRLRLIEEVRKRPILWDVRRKKLENNWGEVASILGFGVSTCKTTWKSLRNCYRIEKKTIQERIAKAKSKGKYNPSKSYNTWHLFDALKFAFDDSENAIAEPENPGQTQANFEPNDSEEEKLKILNTSVIFNRQEDENISNDEFLQQSGLLNSIQIKKEPEIQIDADTYPADSENSNEPHFEQVYKETNIKSVNRQFKLSNDFEDHDQKLSKLAVDNSDLDYSFLISFLYHIKLMSPLQKLQFRAKMSNLMLNISSASKSVNTLESQVLLVDVGDSDGSFLISFWPFLKSMSWSENLQFRSKIADLILNILSTSHSENELSHSTKSDLSSNLA